MADGGLTWQELLDLQDELARGCQLQEELVALVEAGERRRQGKRRIACQVLDGQMALAEAASRFRAWNELPPTVNWNGYRECFAGRNDDERHCHEVVRCAEILVAYEGVPSRLALGRLQDDLKQLLSSPRPLRLPTLDRETK
jgi:hypothetical protein